MAQNFKSRNHVPWDAQADDASVTILGAHLLVKDVDHRASRDHRNAARAQHELLSEGRERQRGSNRS